MDSAVAGAGVGDGPGVGVGVGLGFAELARVVLVSTNSATSRVAMTVLANVCFDIVCLLRECVVADKMGL
jgi:hypothetical protein